MRYVPAGTVTVTVVAGCGGTLVECGHNGVNGKFGVVNSANFGGFPFLPQWLDDPYRTRADVRALVARHARQVHVLDHLEPQLEQLDPDAIFKAVAEVHRRVRGAYAVVAEIAELEGAAKVAP